MIDLSPLDVRKKKDDFRRSLRGYDADQVDSFLDLVADRLEELVTERRRLTEQVATMEEQLTDFRERERALNEALMAAQELREEARSQAERDAELKKKEAKSRAEEIVQEARRRAEEARRELEDLRRRKDRFLHSLRGTLGRLQDELEVEEERLQEASRAALGEDAEAEDGEEEAGDRSVAGDAPPEGSVPSEDGRAVGAEVSERPEEA